MKKITTTKIFALLLMIGFTFGSEAAQKPTGKIEVLNPRIPAPLPSSKIQIQNSRILPTRKGNDAPLFMDILNQADKPDELINVDSKTSGRTEFHFPQEKNGKMLTTTVGFINIPQKGEKLLAPNGHHVLLKNINQDFKAGSNVQVTLHFQKAGPVKLLVPVRAQ